MNLMNKRFVYAINLIYELGKWAFLILILGSVIHYFLFTIFIIDGPSMEPNFHTNQLVLVSRIGLFTGKYKRGDPMVLKFPGDPEHKKYIKRLVGLPGDTFEIKNNTIFINDQPLVEEYIKPVAEEFLPPSYDTVELEYEATMLHKQGKVQTKPDIPRMVLTSDQYFLLGDNRENSNDSRRWYPASRYDLIGPVRFILLPFDNWGPVVNPFYLVSNK